LGSPTTLGAFNILFCYIFELCRLVGSVPFIPYNDPLGSSIPVDLSHSIISDPFVVSWTVPPPLGVFPPPPPPFTNASEICLCPFSPGPFPMLCSPVEDSLLTSDGPPLLFDCYSLEAQKTFPLRLLSSLSCVFGWQPSRSPKLFFPRSKEPLTFTFSHELTFFFFCSVHSLLLPYR